VSRLISIRLAEDHIANPIANLSAGVLLRRISTTRSSGVSMIIGRPCMRTFYRDSDTQFEPKNVHPEWAAG